MRLQSYLQRIQWQGALSPSLDVLGGLMRAHTHHVPFENLDIQLARPMAEGVEEAFEKLVLRRQGGWCYEQNGVFGWALEALGFQVRRVAAAAMRSRLGPLAEANHLALLVGVPANDGLWLVDVGFGGSLLNPLPLTTRTHHHAPFDVGLRRLPDQRWEFFEQLGGDEVAFDFAEAPADERALAERAQYLQTSPASSFVKTLVCQLRRPGTRLALRGRCYTEVDGQGSRQRLLNSADELVAVLSDPFGLEVGDATALWERICRRHEEHLAINSSRPS